MIQNRDNKNFLVRDSIVAIKYISLTKNSGDQPLLGWLIRVEKIFVWKGTVANNICLFEKEKWQPKFVDLIEKSSNQNLLVWLTTVATTNLLFDPGNFVSLTQKSDKQILLVWLRMVATKIH